MQKETRYFRMPAEVIESNFHNILLKDIMIVSTGYRFGDNRNIGYNVERNPGDEYLIKYCISGKGWLVTEGASYSVGPGDVVISGEQVWHSYGADPNDPWSVYWAYFKGSSAGEYFGNMLKGGGGHVFHVGYDSQLMQYFSDIIRFMAKGYASNHILHASNILKLIFSHIITGFEPAGRKSGREMELEGIIRYMAENLQHMLTLEQMAKMAGMSKDYFIKVFAAKYGYTPMDYFIRMKIQKACELLATTDFPIAQIAGLLGYSDYYYFLRVFKRKTGISPKKYRKEAV